MSIYTSFNVGVLGIQSQAVKIGSISDNIANLDTSGYKASNTTFEELINLSRYPAGYSPNGALSNTKYQGSTSGEIKHSDQVTNIAITDNNSFFAVTDQAAAGGTLQYTRAGNFAPDKNGNLVNSNGFYLQGYKLDSNGDLSSALSAFSVTAGTASGFLTTINPASLSVDPIATTTISPVATIDASAPIYAGTPAYNAANPLANMASGAIPAQNTIPVSVYDSKGVQHQLTMGFLKIAPNQWAVEVYGKSSEISGGNPQVNSGTLNFNGDGTLASVVGLSNPFNVSWSAANTNASSLTINWGTAGAIFGTPNATVIGRNDGISQYDGTPTVTRVTRDGAVGGNATGIEITSDGYVVGTYSDSSTRKLYRIPLATFTDPDLLSSTTGDVFQPTDKTSQPFFDLPGTLNVGSIAPSSVESSNVDQSSQLTDLIIAQRAYDANTKTITTTDSMLQTLTQMLGT